MYIRAYCIANVFRREDSLVLVVLARRPDSWMLVVLARRPDGWLVGLPFPRFGWFGSGVDQGRFLRKKTARGVSAAAISQLRSASRGHQSSHLGSQLSLMLGGKRHRVRGKESRSQRLVGGQRIALLSNSRCRGGWKGAYL